MIFTVLPLSRYLSQVTMVSTVYMAACRSRFHAGGSFVPREYMFDMYLGAGLRPDRLHCAQRPAIMFFPPRSLSG